MIFAWTTSRSGRPFMFALPAMAAVVVFVAFVWAVGFKGKTAAVVRSNVSYQKHQDPNEPSYDPNAALMFAKKLTDLEPEEPYFKYELGLSHARVEDMDRAFDVMDWLAPDIDDVDAVNLGSGYADAHLWLSSYYYSDSVGELDEDQRAEISRRHMQLAYEADKENVLAVLGLAGVKRDDAEEKRVKAEELRNEGKTGQADEIELEADVTTAEAVRLFKEGIELPLQSEKQLYASLAVIEILQNQGEDEEARMTGERFIFRHERNAELMPDVLPFWISIVRTCILIGDFERGEKFILQGYQLAQQPQVRTILAHLAAQIEVEKSKTFDDMDDQRQFTDRLYAICKAIKTNVQIPQAYGEMLYFIDGFESNSDKDFWMRDSVLGSAGTVSDSNLDPRIPGIIHVVLGFRELIAGNKHEGQKHWEIAEQQFEFSPFAINYMIQIYTNERDLSKEKRLQLVNAAIEIFPQLPYFFGTRGRYYKEFEDYENAAKDLKFAAANIPGNLSILENLVECLKELGETENLEKYEKQVAEIKERLESSGEDQLSTFYSTTEDD